MILVVIVNPRCLIPRILLHSPRLSLQQCHLRQHRRHHHCWLHCCQNWYLHSCPMPLLHPLCRLTAREAKEPLLRPLLLLWISNNLRACLFGRFPHWLIRSIPTKRTEQIANPRRLSLTTRGTGLLMQTPSHILEGLKESKSSILVAEARQFHWTFRFSSHYILRSIYGQLKERFNCLLSIFVNIFSIPSYFCLPIASRPQLAATSVPHCHRRNM